jgi:protein translocase SecG subunit
MQPILFAQIIVSLILIVLVTIQSSDASIGSSFSSSTQTGFHTKRGPEKMVYLATIVTSIIFIGLSILNIVLWK